MVVAATDLPCKKCVVVAAWRFKGLSRGHRNGRCGLLSFAAVARGAFVFCFVF